MAVSWPDFLLGDTGTRSYFQTAAHQPHREPTEKGMSSVSAARVWPSEWSELRDRATGFPVRRLTHHPPFHNLHFYFHDPAFTTDGRWYVFVSNRTGRFEPYGMRMQSGEIIQLTDSAAWGGWVSQRTPTVYFFSGQEVHALNLDTLEDRTIGVLTDATPASQPSENADGSLVVFFGKTANGHAIYRMRVSDGRVTPIFTTPGRPGHVQCSPVDPGLIMHCDSTIPDGKAKHRIWLLSTDGEYHWHPYTETPQEWLTHESWLGRTGRILTTYWPAGVLEMNTDGSDVRLVATINAMYAVASPDGRYCVVNANFPDRGLFLVEIQTGRMCLLHSPCNAPIEHGTFHVLPTPTFTPDGKSIVFGSEWEGLPDVYLLDIAPAVERREAWWRPALAWERW